MSMDSKDFPGPKHINKKKSDTVISCIKNLEVKCCSDSVIR